MSDYDLIIRNGTVVDGTGDPPFVASIAIAGDRIVQVGTVQGRGRVELDARDRLITPGFVDIHTHYDGQLIWDDRTEPSTSHGVTTVVTGNCGVGFAPCKPGDRAALLNLMEGIEDIPELVMSEGLSWDWENFGDFLDKVGSRRRDIDVACQLPHSCLRVFVMGARGAAGEAATEEDLARMTSVVAESITAGAVGCGTSRTMLHRGADGTAVPTKTAAEAELGAIADGMARAGSGVIQAVLDGANADHFQREIRLLGRVAARAGRPASFTLVQNAAAPDAWRGALQTVADLRRSGVDIKAQVYGRAQGLLLGLDLSYSPLSGHPSYRKLSGLQLESKLEQLRRPEVRAQILAETAEDVGPLPAHYLGRFDMLFELGDPPQYEQPPDRSIAARAAACNMSNEELVYELMTRGDGRTIFQLAFVNYANGNLDMVREMLTDPNTLLGLGDGGAHYGFLCDASYPTFMLTHWTRDRARGDLLSVPAVIRGLSHDCARAVGLLDRGIIAAGYKADINVIDYQRLRLDAPRVRRDLPAGGKRIIQGAEGYVATIVSGVIIREHGEATSALPGRLIRGSRPAPFPGISQRTH
jgi:N-acyl-D-aspartate/D-glutamate deacylase